MSPMRRSSCGGCRLEVNGTTVVARASGALWIEAERTLAAGDLHFEKGSAYGVRGQLLPPYDTMATFERLEAEVSALRPQRIVLMGDTFHDRWAEDRRDSLKADLEAVDEELRAAKKAARGAGTLPEKLERQRKAAQLEARRNEAWRAFDQGIREIERKKDELLDQIARRLEPTTQEEPLFHLRWRLE